MFKLRIAVFFALMTFALFSIFATLNLKMTYANSSNKQILIKSDNKVLSDDNAGEVEEEVEVDEEEPQDYIPEKPEEEEEEQIEEKK